MLFLVQRPGEDITAEWELFFFILPPTNLFFLNKNKNSIFSYKKNQYIAATQLVTISATRWTGKKLYFKGGLTSENIIDMCQECMICL